MSDTMHDFRYSVQICHYLDNVTNKHLVLHSSVSNNFVHCADVWYNAWLFLLSTNLSLFRQCNKQTHEQTNILPFTILSVTILFTVLMSETFYDFLSCVDTCHYLPNVTNKTNKQIAVLNVVQKFHTRCPTVSYQWTFHFHLRIPLHFPVPSTVTTTNPLFQ